MKLFVGLGNPEEKYNWTRHNVGFEYVDSIKERFEFSNWTTFGKGLISTGFINNEKVILLKPQTYMNNSGESIIELKNFYKIDNSDIVVFYDEMALPLEKIRIANKGSAAGHNGIKSIIEIVGDDFVRFRIGIGHPGDRKLVRNYVLGKFTDEEKEKVIDDFSFFNDNLTDVVAENYQLLMSKNSIKNSQKN